jgi:hypothetical protein
MTATRREKLPWERGPGSGFVDTRPHSIQPGGITPAYIEGMSKLVAGAQMAAAALVIVVASSCVGGAPSTLVLNSASVDATYTCPNGADNAPYDLLAMIDLHNGTSSAVTIKSVAAAMTLAEVKGGWLERVGDKYEASGVTFTPAVVSAGGSAKLKITIPSACTNGTLPSAGASYGDYSVALVVTASSGTYTIGSKNRHRIVAA